MFADNGQGLTRDASILREALRALGWRATLTPQSPMRPPSELRFAPERAVDGLRRLRDALRSSFGTSPRWDLNIFLERVDPGYLPLARANWFAPHQEWLTDEDRRHLGTADLVLFKTEHMMQELGPLAARPALLGFTSQDRRVPQAKDWRHQLHVAGWNRTKGTARLLDLWQRHPDWSTLTVVAQGHETLHAANVNLVSRRLADAPLGVLLNSCGVHVAPSEVESYGHTLGEAMSCGAIIITTNAPPMNEVVRSAGAFLVSVESSEPMSAGYR